MSVFWILASGFSIALASGLLLTPLVRAWARSHGWVDQPDERKVHREPTVGVGGLAIVGSFLAAMGFFEIVQLLGWLPASLAFPNVYFWIGLVIIVGTGLLDDIYHITFRHKFVIQILVAYLLIWGGFRIDLNFLPLGKEQQVLLSVPVTLLWTVGIMNAVNLLDGLDGLAAGVSGIAIISLATAFGALGNLGLVMIAIALVGALLGFLRYNFNRASIFMGDTGSLFLGYMLAAYSLQGHTSVFSWSGLLIPVVALGVPILDTTLAVIRRLFRRMPIFAPDNDHIHHRLARHFAASHAQRKAVLVLYALGALFGLTAVALATPRPFFGITMVIVSGVVSLLLLRALDYIHLRDTLRMIRDNYRTFPRPLFRIMIAADASRDALPTPEASEAPSPSPSTLESEPEPEPIEL